VVLTDHLSGESPAVLREHDGAVSERAARRTLRAQIARMERELGETVLAAFPHVTAPPSLQPARGPRMLGLGELERVRDDLAERIARARVVVARRADLEAESRALLEEMLREPARHKGVWLPVADLGERGCGAYHVCPRVGVIGRLMGWWHVKLSSGCPLATGQPAAPLPGLS
jgi:hypothetical protein